MYVRAVVVPSDATALSTLSNPQDHLISGFRVNEPATVLEILDLVVQQHQAGSGCSVRSPKIGRSERAKTRYQS
jgi:hypothetical protein